MSTHTGTEVKLMTTVMHHTPVLFLKAKPSRKAVLCQKVPPETNASEPLPMYNISADLQWLQSGALKPCCGQMNAVGRK